MPGRGISRSVREADGALVIGGGRIAVKQGTAQDVVGHGKPVAAVPVGADRPTRVVLVPVCTA